jgi:hypothetical protein
MYQSWKKGLRFDIGHIPSSVIEHVFFHAVHRVIIIRNIKQNSDDNDDDDIHSILEY